VNGQGSQLEDYSSEPLPARSISVVFNWLGHHADTSLLSIVYNHVHFFVHTVIYITGPWTPTPTTFNNLYFSVLLGLKWSPNLKAAKFQYEDPSKKLMMLPSDIALIEDPEFKQYVEIYAKDQKRFFKDFAAAFQKLEELGTENLFDV
jgi:Peroxidase